MTVKQSTVLVSNQNPSVTTQVGLVSPTKGVTAVASGKIVDVANPTKIGNLNSLSKLGSLNDLNDLNSLEDLSVLENLENLENVENVGNVGNAGLRNGNGATLLKKAVLNTRDDNDLDDDMDDINGNVGVVERQAQRRRQPILFLVPKTLKEKQPFIYLVRRYFNYISPLELILNVMLLVGEFDEEKVAENILSELSTPLDFPLEQESLKEVPLLVEVRRILGKYQYLASQHMFFRPDINAVGNALLITGHFDQTRVVNEIAALNKRPAGTRFFYRSKRRTEDGSQEE